MTNLEKLLKAMEAKANSINANQMVKKESYNVEEIINAKEFGAKYAYENAINAIKEILKAQANGEELEFMFE